MKKLTLLIASLWLLLSGCSPGFQKDEKIVKDTSDSKESAVVPKYSISDEYYKTLIPFQKGAARGLVVQGLNSRLDMDEFETGLMRIAQKTFSTKDYLFQEGQYLDKRTAQLLVERKRTDAQQAELEKKLNKKVPNIGLNPVLEENAAGTAEEKNAKSPIYISNILEHNYLVKKSDNKVELGGVVIGLAMNSVHYFNTEQGYPREQQISVEESLAQGKKMAQTVLELLRKKDELKNVPIIIAIYRQEAKSSLVPGNLLAYTKVDKGDETADDWESVDEKYYLFPSDEASKNYREDAMKVSNFRSDLSEYFPDDFTAVVGRGFYKDGQLQELKISIPVQFNGKAEIIGFTQYVTGLVMEHFPNYIKVEVNIYSVNNPEAVITRDVDQEEPVVHIFS